MDEKVTLSYISDTRYFVDSKGNWYVNLTFPIDEISSKMTYVSKWIFYGRLYKTKNTEGLYRLPIEDLNFSVEFVGTWEQKKGGVGYLRNFVKNILMLREVTKQSNILWLKFNFVSSYIVAVFGNLNNKTIMTHMVGDIDCLAHIQTNVFHKIKRIIQKKIVKKCNKKAKIQVFVSKNLANKYSVNDTKTVISHENRISSKVIFDYGVNRILGKGKLNIVFVGRLADGKGIFDLLKAVQGLGDKVHLTIIGDGELKNDLKAYVELNNLNTFVKFTGNKPWGEELFKELSRKDVLILPSYSEGLPLVILEAMSMGLPVIASEVGGIPEIVKDKKNGLLFRPGDITTLKEHICCLQKNPNLYKNLSKNALQTASENVINTQINKINDALLESL